MEAPISIGETEVVAGRVGPVQNQGRIAESIVRQGAHYDAVYFARPHVRIHSELTWEMRCRIEVRNRGVQITLALRGQLRALRRS
jgi:hypothetical protein